MFHASSESDGGGFVHARVGGGGVTSGVRAAAEGAWQRTVPSVNVAFR